ncbi:hypothetical protein FVR03_23520 [Pontibacter qinzhouensis]|uniref:Uncharacterized protein n=1 Tax=Pontibacter qinzhouensis TaxID=2603253 RepID=A0A5C8IJ49_9BACT|nr:hypothetical protein [Pontibacter qinzhouensis]TXK21151.1 hypothetical protein FVR03_23520 [Pontibacter qinzhouensis]
MEKFFEALVVSFAVGMFTFMASIWLSLPAGLALAKIIYNKAVTSMQFVLGFLVLSFLSNFIVGFILSASQSNSAGSVFGLTIFQYFPVFILSILFSKKNA